jgi:hypothetical protein
MSKEKRKIKIPKSVLDLKLSPKKFAKKHSIRLKGKGISKGERKRNERRLRNAYSEAAINGLNKAVKILAENSPDNKKIMKVKDGVDNIISNPKVMKRVSKLYRKNPKSYPNMIYLPHMIMNTLVYYAQDSISDDEKEIGKALDTEGLIEFCEKILKDEIRRYRKLGVSDDVAYQLATVIPTTKLLKNGRQWYKKLIQSMYMIAETSDVDVTTILNAVAKIDKKKSIDKKDFFEGFFSEFILTKSSNKNHSFNDTQKELHETLIERTLEYLDGIKGRKAKDILKTYIKRRKTAESYKNDTKRVIKFIDHANSNSSYNSLKSVIQELVADNSSNELYLS